MWSPKRKVPLGKASKSLLKKMSSDVKLCTDFKDYPDEEFYDKGMPFERYRKSKISRAESFHLLKKLGFKVPNHGESKNFITKLIESKKDEDIKFVVHLDEYEHSQFNKLLVSAKEAFDKYSDKFCVEYISSRPISYRYLKIGQLDFGLVYESDDLWKSNCGTVSIRIACQGDEPKYHPILAYPLFSIDYIKDQNEQLYAIDLDFAPILDNTGIEMMLTPKEVYEEIANAVKHFKKGVE